jgi:SAM-dependent methyltransferase
LITRTPNEWRKLCTQINSGYIPSNGNTYDSGIHLVTILQDKFKLFPNPNKLRICDVGSGNGRLPMGLVGLGLEPKSYYGLEIIPNCVSFCNIAFAGYANFTFKLLDASNPRYWQSASRPELVEYPLKDESVNLVIANSLFSHTQNMRIAKRNIDEMLRVLEPGGTLYSSWIVRDKRDENAAMTKYLLSDVEELLPNVAMSEVLTTKAQPQQTGFISIKEE